MRWRHVILVSTFPESVFASRRTCQHPVSSEQKDWPALVSHKLNNSARYLPTTHQFSTCTVILPREIETLVLPFQELVVRPKVSTFNDVFRFPHRKTSSILSVPNQTGTDPEDRALYLLGHVVVAIGVRKQKVNLYLFLE